ncbi:hypothetical protein NDU88_001307 [Pleurodeles waltl]|uniref:Uncharacterized protein n=1 Tax=Pleurodeles waltl TaxID=8319 RepID=A0AAV7WN75_PLEWA|nr:hypothetical protein NDU88_001307 [Pleurodeles waltl]
MEFGRMSALTPREALGRKSILQGAWRGAGVRRAPVPAPHTGGGLFNGPPKKARPSFPGCGGGTWRAARDCPCISLLVCGRGSTQAALFCGPDRSVLLSCLVFQFGPGRNLQFG